MRLGLQIEESLELGEMDASSWLKKGFVLKNEIVQAGGDKGSILQENELILLGPNSTLF